MRPVARRCCGPRPRRWCASRCSESSPSRSHRSRRQHPLRRTRARTWLLRSPTPIRCRARRPGRRRLSSSGRFRSTCSKCRCECNRRRRRLRRSRPGRRRRRGTSRRRPSCAGRIQRRSSSRLRTAPSRRRSMYRGSSCLRWACSCCSVRPSSPGRLGSWRDDDTPPHIVAILAPFAACRLRVAGVGAGDRRSR